MKEKIQLQVEKIHLICNKIDSGENYLEDVISLLPEITEIVNQILEKYDINETFIMQILKDIIYGVEHNDVVIIRDTLRYGLLQLYDNIGENIEVVYE